MIDISRPRFEMDLSYSLKIVVLLLSSAVYAFSCTCAPLKTARTIRDAVVQRGEGKTAIFEGTVEKQESVQGQIGPEATALSITGNGKHRLVTFRVSHAYRGQMGAKVSILTGTGDGDCGFDFHTNRKYLVYATSIDANTFFTSTCAGTAALEQAGP